MDHDAVAGVLRPTRRSDVNATCTRLRDAPKRRGTSVAEKRRVTTGQHRCHPAPARSQSWMSDGVNASMDLVKTPGLQTVADPASAEPDLNKLTSGDHAVLVGGQPGDSPVRLRPPPIR